MFTRTLTALCLATALLAAGATPAAEVPEGISDGIKVHGHWKIEVYNPDGTLVTSYEFDNALTSGGARELCILLCRAKTVGAWMVGMDHTGGAHPCNDGSAPAECFVQDAATGIPSHDNIFVNLSVTGHDIYPWSVTLSGSATGAQTGTIDRVRTLLGYCEPNVAPATCASSSSPWYDYTVTSTTLPSPVSVQTGQIIQVTVTISFS